MVKDVDPVVAHAPALGHQVQGVALLEKNETVNKISLERTDTCLENDREATFLRHLHAVYGGRGVHLDVLDHQVEGIGAVTGADFANVAQVDEGRV